MYILSVVPDEKGTSFPMAAVETSCLHVYENSKVLQIH